MRVRLTRAFTFEAAHRLPTFPEGHKCRRLHGHSFRIEIEVAGPVPEESGYLIDYADLKTAMQPLLAQLDHYYLNEVPGLENPTSEVLARWIWQRLKPALPLLDVVRVQETCNTACEYRG